MILNKVYKTLVLCLTFFSVNSYAEVINQKHSSLNDLKGMHYHGSNSDSLIEGGLNPEDIRLREVKNAALSVGAQHGYISRMNFLKNSIDYRSLEMDNIYDFNTLMKVTGGKLEEYYFVPPVISKTLNRTILSDNARKLIISGESYYIQKSGKLTTNAPNWRQYLIFDQPVSISKPVANLLPRDDSEQESWDEWVEQGWMAGIKQAEKEGLYRVRILRQDILGMIEYNNLVLNGIVNKPVIIKTTQNVVGGRLEMRINEQIIQLSVPSTFDTNSSNWEALILDSRESLRYPTEIKI